MARRELKQLGLFAASLAVIAASAFVSQYVWKESGLKSLQAVNEQRVQLVAGAVKAEISRQDHLPFVLSLDPDVRSALAAPRDASRLRELSRKLTLISRSAEARAL
jgi:C4-dicarboxylate-specific signal transduction histidine kinase